MTTQAILSGFLALLIGLVVYLANRLGKKTAQLEAIKQKEKQDAEEKELGKTITYSVHNMSESDVRNRLHEIANRQQR